MPFEINSVALPSTGTVFFQSAPQNGSGTERPAMFYCNVTGCPGSLPTAPATDGLGGFDLLLPAVGNRVFFSAQDFGLGYSDCTANGVSCTTAQYLGANAKGTRGMSADATNIYFIDSVSRGQGVAMCAQTDTACTPTVLVAGPGPAQPITDLIQTAVSKGVLYWIKQGRSGFVEGKILKCDLGAACVVPAPAIAGTLDSPTELLVDADGVYWITTGTNAANTAKVQRCTLPGCIGGAQDMATGLETGGMGSSGTHGLASDDKFVYFADSQRVLRIAK
jgi:hypothetical protein